jgi:hypothetical protein
MMTEETVRHTVSTPDWKRSTATYKKVLAQTENFLSFSNPYKTVDVRASRRKLFEQLEKEAVTDIMPSVGEMTEMSLTAVGCHRVQDLVEGYTVFKTANDTKTPINRPFGWFCAFLRYRCSVDANKVFRIAVFTHMVSLLKCPKPTQNQTPKST